MNWILTQYPYSKKQTSMIRRKFTQEEDAKLCQLVNQYGAKKWDQIAKMMPGRTGRQCRDRYRNYLIPGFFNGQWSQEEDELLHEKFNQMGRQWARMMQFFPGRSANSLKNRWNYFVCRLNQEKKNDETSNNNKNNGIVNNKNETNINNNEKLNNGIANNDAAKIIIPENEKLHHSIPNIKVYNNELLKKITEKDASHKKNVQENNQSFAQPQKSAQPQQEERIIYGVNASTQTDECDLIEHERSMNS